MAPVDSAIEEILRADDNQMARWRWDEALRLGYDVRQALQILEARVSPHDLGELLKSGCPRDTALRILL